VPRNGKFYWYVPIRNRATSRMGPSGVAVGDSPTEDHSRDALGKTRRPRMARSTRPFFIDDDDQAYLYWGNPKLQYVRLKREMILVQRRHCPDSTHRRRQARATYDVRGGPVGCTSATDYTT